MLLPTCVLCCRVFWSQKVPFCCLFRQVNHGHCSNIYSVPRCTLTPWSRVLEKLTGSQLVKKFPAFYGTRRFITAFTSARHLSLTWGRSIHSTSPHPTSWRSILILSSHLRPSLWVFPVVSFPQVSPPKPWIHLSCPPYVLHAQPISFFSIQSPQQYWVSSTDN